MGKEAMDPENRVGSMKESEAGRGLDHPPSAPRHSMDKPRGALNISEGPHSHSIFAESSKEVKI